MKNLLLPFLTLFVCFTAQAQESVTDDELKKYAIAIDSVNNMKATLLNDIKLMVDKSEKISNARYNELSKIIKDEAKLKESNATEEEITFLREVITLKTEGTAKITTLYQQLAKEYVGAATFNKVKKALSADESVRARYRAYMDELEKAPATTAN